MTSILDNEIKIGNKSSIVFDLAFCMASAGGCENYPWLGIFSLLYVAHWSAQSSQIFYF